MIRRAVIRCGGLAGGVPTPLVDIGEGPFLMRCCSSAPATASVAFCCSPGPVLRSWPVDRERSFLIGDQDSDLAAAAAAAIPFRRFRGGNIAEFTEALVRHGASVPG